MDRGAYIGSDTLQAGRYRAAGMLAMLALFLHVAIPLLYDLAPASVQGLMQITICSGGEAKQITVDASGQPVQQAPANHHDCYSCMHHCGAMALVAAVTFVPPLFDSVLFSLIGGLTHGLLALDAQARAPPV